jgi:hypothetical protein
LPSTSLLRGTKSYLVTVSGATARDGTPMTAPITFSFTPSGGSNIGYTSIGARRVA